jgi:hypothetical protein
MKNRDPISVFNLCHYIKVYRSEYRALLDIACDLPGEIGGRDISGPEGVGDSVGGCTRQMQFTHSSKAPGLVSTLEVMK